jgi:hypothetical protein
LEVRAEEGVDGLKRRSQEAVDQAHRTVEHPLPKNSKRDGGD